MSPQFKKSEKKLRMLHWRQISRLSSSRERLQECANGRREASYALNVRVCECEILRILSLEYAQYRNGNANSVIRISHKHVKKMYYYTISARYYYQNRLPRLARHIVTVLAKHRSAKQVINTKGYCEGIA